MDHRAASAAHRMHWQIPLVFEHQLMRRAFIISPATGRGSPSGRPPPLGAVCFPLSELLRDKRDNVSRQVTVTSLAQTS